MPAPTVQQVILNKALSMVGSLADLARALQVPETQLTLWLSGTSAVPPWAFLRIVDLINNITFGEPPKVE